MWTYCGKHAARILRPTSILTQLEIEILRLKQTLMVRVRQGGGGGSFKMYYQCKHGPLHQYQTKLSVLCNSIDLTHVFCLQEILFCLLWSGPYYIYVQNVLPPILTVSCPLSILLSSLLSISLSIFLSIFLLSFSCHFYRKLGNWKDM